MQGSSIFSCFTNLDGKGFLVDEASRLTDGEYLFLIWSIQVSPVTLQAGIICVTDTIYRNLPHDFDIVHEHHSFILVDVAQVNFEFFDSVFIIIVYLWGFSLFRFLEYPCDFLLRRRFGIVFLFSKGPERVLVFIRVV